MLRYLDFSSILLSTGSPIIAFLEVSKIYFNAISSTRVPAALCTAGIPGASLTEPLSALDVQSLSWSAEGTRADLPYLPNKYTICSHSVDRSNRRLGFVPSGG